VERLIGVLDPGHLAGSGTHVGGGLFFNAKN
jgi:hypothetical protein